MIDAGLPIVQCLEILGEQSENKLLRTTITSIRRDVEGGCTLADALRKTSKIFDDLYVNMVEAGEAGGILKYHSQSNRSVYRKSKQAKKRRSRAP